jgi:hypothetical protein
MDERTELKRVLKIFLGEYEFELQRLTTQLIGEVFLTM